MSAQTTLFEPKAIFELTNYTLDTWNLDNAHAVDVAKRLNDILMDCAEEYRKRPDRIGKEAYKKLERAQEFLEKADALLLNPYDISYKDAPFSEIMLEDYKSLDSVGTFSEDDLLRSAQLSNAQNCMTLGVWLVQNTPVSISKGNKRREIITKKLYALYQELTGKEYIRNNKPGRQGTRIHNPFSKVAILMDKLAGNPHYALDCIDIWKNEHLNISDIVKCPKKTISAFCQSLEKILFE